jgi:predicted membrane protein
MEETMTDVMYDLTEYMEKQRNWMVLIVFACLILAPGGLLLNGLFLLLYTVRFQATIISVRGFFFLLNILICFLLVYFGFKQAIFLRKWNKKLKKIQEFEKKVFSEVVQEE